MQVRRFIRSSRRKLKTSDSIVTEIAKVYSFHTTGNVRCTVTCQRYTSFSRLRQCEKTTAFMQNGASLQTARLKQLLRHHFGDERIISTQFPTVWPPKSPDLNPCDFWLWEYLKSMVYRDPIPSLFDLKESLEHECVTFTNSCCFQLPNMRFYASRC